MHDIQFYIITVTCIIIRYFYVILLHQIVIYAASLEEHERKYNLLIDFVKLI